MHFRTDTRQPVLLAVLLIVVVHAYAGEQIRAINLVPYGFSEVSYTSNHLPLIAINGQVAFVGEHAVAVSFVVPTDPRRLGPRDSVGNASWILRTVLFDLRTGNARAEWEWKNATDDVRVVSHGGRLFVSGGGRLDVRNADGNILWSKVLPKTEILPSRPFGHVFVSPSGATVFVMSDETLDTERIIPYRGADGLQLSGGMTIPMQGVIGPQTATDKGFAYITQSFPYDLVYEPLLGGPPATLWKCLVSQCAYHMQSVVGSNFVFDDTPHSLALGGLDGRALAGIKFGKKKTISGVMASADGNRLLVRLNESTGGSRFTDTFPRLKKVSLAVLDGHDLSVVSSTIDIDASRGRPVHHAAICDSGKIVGYVAGHSVYIWDVGAARDYGK